jgi:GNAT superfamily N-acetyltransferase
MQALTLRDATRDDLALVVRFVRALAEYERMLDECTGTEADFAASLFGEKPVVFAMIAELDGLPVGFAMWFFTFSTFTGKHSLYVEDVFVEPAHRGKGVGRALFADLARRAVAAGCPRMEWSVLDWNEPAIRFYRGIGAVPMEEWTVQRLAGPALAALAAPAERAGAPGPG